MTYEELKEEAIAYRKYLEEIYNEPVKERFKAERESDG